MKIVLPLAKTELHQQLEVLSKRYHRRDRFYEEMEEVYGRERAGYQGEKQLDYFLNLADLQRSYSFADLRLKWDKHFFRMDRVILTQSVCFIIESKYLKGQLTLNGEAQLIQQTDDSQKCYENPHIQVKLQEKQLRKVLNSLGFANLPIHSLIVFTNRNAILNLGGHPDLIALQQLTFRIDELCQHYQTVRTATEIQQLAQTLLKKHTIKRENSIIRFNIDVRAIQTGVLCAKCGYTVMTRIHGTWSCQKCQFQDRNAHISALTDYAILFNPLITNKTARQFLNVDSRYTMRRLLSELNLPTHGYGKLIQYDLTKFN